MLYSHFHALKSNFYENSYQQNWNFNTVLELLHDNLKMTPKHGTCINFKYTKNHKGLEKGIKSFYNWL